MFLEYFVKPNHPHEQKLKEPTRTKQDFLSPTPHNEVQILHNLMRSPDKINTKELKKDTRSDMMQTENQPEYYDSFHVCTKEQELIGLPSSQQKNPTNEERFNSFQVVLKEDRSRTPSPFPEKNKKKVHQELKPITKSNIKKPSLASPLSPKNEDFKEIKTSLNDGTEEHDQFQSFQMFQKQDQIKSSKQNESIDRLEFNSFKVYHDNSKIDENDNQTKDKPGTTVGERNVDFSSFSTEVSVFNIIFNAFVN